MNEAETRRTYAELAPGDKVEVVHDVKIGMRTHRSRTVGTVVGKERRECGMDGGHRRARDDKYWFDHLHLVKEDGERTGVTIDEFTELKKLN